MYAGRSGPVGREERMRQDRKEPVVGVKSLRRHRGMGYKTDTGGCCVRYMELM